MSTSYNVGDKVEWDWGNGTATGKIDKVYTEKVTRTIKGNDVTRNADREEPAYYIEQSDDGAALKSHSEVRKSE
jgi:hypothetical protein